MYRVDPARGPHFTGGYSDVRRAFLFPLGEIASVGAMTKPNVQIAAVKEMKFADSQSLDVMKKVRSLL